MEPVPTDCRCSICKRSLWFVRPRDVGDPGYFECRRCRKPYRATEPWSPHVRKPVGVIESKDEYK